MAAVLVVSAIGGGGVAFMVRFFIALCKETKNRACRVVRVFPESDWKTATEGLASVAEAPANLPTVSSARARI